MRGRRLAVALVVAALALLYFRHARGYPWELAAVIATATGALVWAAQRTADRLRSLRRRE
ncbi:MAG TPA: hypothetical protein VMT16_09845 [Thermoanaerobaculia bacterium]|nr:hypothetical protein [Thermoanaerobaculia bacterium]